MSRINSMVAELALNKESDLWLVSSGMLAEDEVMNESYILRDGRHMTQEGCQFWTEILEQYLLKEK